MAFTHRAHPPPGEELEEEVVAVPRLTDEWRGEPLVQLHPAGLRQAVDNPVGQAALFDLALRDQPVAH